MVDLGVAVLIPRTVLVKLTLLAILEEDCAELRLKIREHRQKCGSFESAITMSCGRLTMEANGKITEKVYGD